jgi:hypothetical protein
MLVGQPLLLFTKEIIFAAAGKTQLLLLHVESLVIFPSVNTGNVKKVHPGYSVGFCKPCLSADVSVILLEDLYVSSVYIHIQDREVFLPCIISRLYWYVFLTLLIACILIELNCSFMTSTNAPLIYTNTILHVPTYFGITYAILKELYTKI